MRLSSVTVTVGASIGVAITEDGVRASELTRRADIAMYSAKARGKNRVETFSPDEHGEVARHRTLEDQLPHAIARGEIAVWFQPYLNLGTGEWLGVEALFQWRHPALGEVNCRELLALAERTGDLASVTAFVLRTVGEQIAALPGGLQVGMNIGAHQLLDPRFTTTVLTSLAECGLPADRLTLEIIESEHMDDPVARDQLHRLSGHGVRIALDDFGTGYSSLSYLRRFPFNRIKIDRSFITDIAARPDAQAIVRTILMLAESLGMTTTAEGVETDDQRLLLLAIGCHEMQGFLFSRAVPADKAMQLMRDGVLQDTAAA
jgi:predicted signal transduction protein with EAL and GGDEF domain